jgi:protein MAK16
LIERLKSKAYGDAPLNVNESVWQAVLDRERKVVEDEAELDMVDDETDEEELEEEAEDDWGDREFVSDMSGDEDEDAVSDLEDIAVRFHSVKYFLCSQDHDRAMIPKTMRMTRASQSQTQDLVSASQRLVPRYDPIRRRTVSIYAPAVSPTYDSAVGPRVEVEYENEIESVPISKSVLAGW